MTTADIIRVDRPTTSSKLFAHTRWDAIPVMASLFHLAQFLGYVFLSFFRDDVGAIRKELRKRSNGDLMWGNIELAAFATVLFVMFLFNWRYIIFYFLPFFYLGHCFSYLNGYFRHYGADPDKPVAWGVSSYGKIYNWLFFYNGYHAEHHFRPKVHWTKMEEFHQGIAEMQKQEGVRTIKRAHMLGFLDPDLPKRGAAQVGAIDLNRSRAVR